MKDNKKAFKMAPEELEEFVRFQRKGSTVPAKKGRGSYRRKPKHSKQIMSD